MHVPHRTHLSKPTRPKCVPGHPRASGRLMLDTYPSADALEVLWVLVVRSVMQCWGAQALKAS